MAIAYARNKDGSFSYFCRGKNRKGKPCGNRVTTRSGYCGRCKGPVKPAPRTDESGEA